MIQGSGTGVFGLVTVKTEPADTSRGFMGLTAVGRALSSQRADRP